MKNTLASIGAFIAIAVVVVPVVAFLVSGGVELATEDFTDTHLTLEEQQASKLVCAPASFITAIGVIVAAYTQYQRGSS